MRISTGAEIFVCVDEVLGEASFAATVETWVTGREKGGGMGGDMKEVAKMGFHWRVGL